MKQVVLQLYVGNNSLLSGETISHDNLTKPIQARTRKAFNITNLT
jgi:hypothetical protein